MMSATNTQLVRRWISSMLLGESPEFNIKGTRSQLEALSEALVATQLFERELTNEGATVAGVMSALHRKHASVQRFEREFGYETWPL